MDAKRDTWEDLRIPVVLGETICRTLKQIYYPNTPWPDCYKLVANKFTQLKIKARIYYPNKSEIEMLQELNKYDALDIQDALDNDDHCKKFKQ